jgi:hypothetical protein
MPRSFLSAFSSLIRAGTKSGPQRVIGWTTVRRLVLYYTAMVALVSLVDFSLPLPPSEKGRMLAPWLERMMLGTATGMRIVPAWLDAILTMATAFQRFHRTPSR